MELPDFIQIPGILYRDKEIKSLDRDVYGIIYWYTKLKLKRCILSNKQIADLFDVSPGSVANSISRLANKKYIGVVLDEKNHRSELVPNITYGGATPSSVDEPPFTDRLTPPSSVDEHNNINIIREVNKSIDTNVSIEKPQFGNPEINEVRDYFLQVMGIPKEDCTQRQSRQYWWLLLGESKTGIQGVKWLIDRCKEDTWYAKNITSAKDLYYKRIKILQRKKSHIESFAVMKGGEQNGEPTMEIENIGRDTLSDNGAEGLLLTGD